jgi:predicted ATPase
VHFERGRDYPRAVQYLRQAGENAIQRYSHREAITHLTQGLALLATLPETAARVQQELDLQLVLGTTLMASKGPVPEVEQAYVRARALCQQVGETPQLFPILQGLSWFYETQGGLQTARELGEQLVRLAQRVAAPTSPLEAHTGLGTILFHLGDYATAWTHLTQGLPLADPVGQRVLALRSGLAPGVRCLVFAASTLWCSGYPAQAVRQSQEALALAQALAHPYSLVMAQHFAAHVYQRLREALAVQTQAEVLLTLATAQGFPLLEGFGTFWRGWALAMQGQDTVGLAQMRQGMATVLAVGNLLSRPLCLVLLAEATGHAGKVEEGLHLLSEALTAFEASGRGDMLAEAYRLQGELLLRQAVPEVAPAEACFQYALTIARRQQAKSWELRAAISLARLWQHQGKRAAAHQLLAEIYGWFTEGFDTADLQEAKALLEEREE